MKYFLPLGAMRAALLWVAISVYIYWFAYTSAFNAVI